MNRIIRGISKIYAQKKKVEKKTQREHTFLSQNRIAENGHTEHTEHTHTHVSYYIHYIGFGAVDIDFSSIFWLHRHNYTSIRPAMLPILINDSVSFCGCSHLLLRCFLFLHSSNFHADFIWMKIQQTQSQWNHELCYSDVHDWTNDRAKSINKMRLRKVDSIDLFINSICGRNAQCIIFLSRKHHFD